MCASVFSQETEFYQASQLYKNGAYGEAIAKYESILEAGKASGPLYYNLGNCYLEFICYLVLVYWYFAYCRTRPKS